MTGFPLPPDELLDHQDGLFLPSEDTRAWVYENIIVQAGELHNPDHSHLADADVCFLWTNTPNRKAGKRILGTAQMGSPTGKPWSAGRQEQQLREWFQRVPDFLITLDAQYVASIKDWPSICALIEHELYHCFMEADQFGEPRYDRQNMPIWGIRPHDVEQFVGVVRRYGSQAASVDQMVRVANKAPEIAPAMLDGICGCCLRLIA